MRPRHVVLLVVLAAVPIGIALLVGRTHTRTPAPVGATLVGLDLKGGSAQLSATACGIPHHYTEFRAGETVHFGGSVTSAPKGSWKVKLKLKSCIGGRFEDAGQVAARTRHDNTFKGSFRAPVPGYYFVRASVYVGGRRVARGDKQFFNVR